MYITLVMLGLPEKADIGYIHTHIYMLWGWCMLTNNCHIKQNMFGFTLPNLQKSAYHYKSKFAVDGMIVLLT